jgi:hypothetical protein
MNERLGWFLLALSIVGCNTSHDAADDDAGTGARDAGDVTTLPDGRIVRRDGGSVIELPDGRVIDRRDAGGVIELPDGRVIDPRDGGSGTGTAHVGTPCETAEDCPGLFCSGSGSGDRECPDDAVCAYFGDPDIGYCLQRCDPRASECADGYSCERGIADAPVCYPAGCTTDEDCEPGDLCGPGVSFAMQCYSPEAAVGDPCALTDDCSVGGYCVSEDGWGAPGGTCITFCTLATGAECGEGTTCVPWGFMSDYGSCVPTCDDEHPCRPGYGCTPTGEGSPNACVARCTDDSQCTEDRSCNFITGNCA